MWLGMLAVELRRVGATGVEVVVTYITPALNTCVRKKKRAVAFKNRVSTTTGQTMENRPQDCAT